MGEVMAQAVDELQRFRLDGRVAIVTGGTGGIGSRLCEALSRVGARVVVHGRDAGRAQAVAQRLRHEDGEAVASVADLTSRAEADRMVEEAMTAYGRVDVIVNTVGGGAGGALYPAESYPEAEWDRILDLNLRSALLPTQAAARAMIAGGNGGRVLHFSSVRGQLGIDNGVSAYVAAKGAPDAPTRPQATAWGKHRVIAQELGISQAPLREALRDLEQLGCVVHEPFRGCSVRELSIADLLEAFPVRSALESVAARLAAEQITDEELERLAELIEEMRAGAAAGDAIAESAAGPAFHAPIVAAAPNALLSPPGEHPPPP